MKKNDLLIVIFIFITIFSIIIVKPISDLDEIWNYNTARAIAKNPVLLLCDEPTGALDYNTGKQILKLLQDTCRKEKMTVIIITHNSAIAPMADKVIHFKNGKAENIKINQNQIAVDEIEW